MEALQITTEHQEIYEGRVDIILFQEGPVKFRYSVTQRENGKIIDIDKIADLIFEGIEHARHIPLVSGFANFLSRNHPNIIQIHPFEVREDSNGTNYIDFSDKRTWRTFQYCCKSPEDYRDPDYYEDPKFQERDSLLRRFGR